MGFSESDYSEAENAKKLQYIWKSYELYLSSKIALDVVEIT